MNQGTNLGSQKGRWIILAALVAVLGALLFLMPGGLLQAQQTAETFYYHENGDEPVVTLTADDPEGVTPIQWDILMEDIDADLPGGADDDIEETDIIHGRLFEVDGGVLSFKDKPNFEAAGDVLGLQDPTLAYPDDNKTYKVVVQASDGGVTEWVQYFKVTVIVLDVEETGKVEWTVDADGEIDTSQATDMLLEFQAGADLLATVTDPDSTAASLVADQAWKWYRSASDAGPWTVIDGATVAAYTVSDRAESNDLGMYLRAEATYTDRRGSNKTAEFVSRYAVRPAKVEGNSVPEFAPTAIARDVQEGPAGMTVGAPVTATDTDGDVLNYTIAENGQVDGENAFKIDPETGQITTIVLLNYDPTNGTTPPRSFTVMVTATDSAGGETDDTVGGEVPDDATVTITLLNVNEAPAFGVDGRTTTPANDDDANFQGMVQKAEGGVDVAWSDAVSEYTVNDEEGVAINAGKWSLSGDDAALFELTGSDDDERNLEFKNEADFENPGDMNEDNIYEVTVVASDGTNRAERAVRVKITDSDEAGEIMLSDVNPVTGNEITATLEDSDGDVIDVAWAWYGLDDTQAENAENIAEAIALTDGASTAIDDATSNTYTPGAGDIGMHLVAVARYVDRTEDNDNDPTIPANAVIGLDGVRFQNIAISGATATVIADPANSAPEFEEGSAAVRYVEENAEADETIGAPLMIDDGDLPDDSHTFTLSRTDAVFFDIVSGTGEGQLMTKADLDYEKKNSYTVVVTVVDGSGESNDTARITVTIQVKDLDEKPEITGDGNIQHEENDTGTVVTLRASDPEHVTPIHWAILMTNVDADLPGGAVGDEIEVDDIAHGSFFKVEDGVLSFKDKPDFEAGPTTDAGDVDPPTDQTYKVVVQASDGGRMEWVQYFKLAVQLLNLEEEGKVEWTVTPPGGDEQKLLEFQAGAVLTAMVTDPDGPVPIVPATTSWKWFRSRSSGSWTEITSDADGDATDNTYTVSDSTGNDDRGMYLRAEATYTDDRAANKMADFVSPYRVRPAKVEDNSVPEFSPTAHTRRVHEGKAGMEVGAPVTATDADGDVRNYRISTNDTDAFEIDPETGQIATAIDLDFDADGVETSFTIMVEAVDSAGGASDPTATVTITLLNVNEAPDFGDETPNANIRGMAADKNEEGFGADHAWDPVVSSYMATDQEGVAIGDGKWSLSGDDAAKFKLTGDTDDARILEFREKADFEMRGNQDRDNIYEVTVVASDGSESSELDVTVKILDRDEAGEITISDENPVAGQPVTATLADSDGDVINVGWAWHLLDDTQAATTTSITAAINATGDNSTAIGKATSDTYTPKSSDIGSHLVAVARYMDRTEDEDNSDPDIDATVPGFGNVRFANRAFSAATAAVIDDPDNAAPEFTEGATAVRYVEENAETGETVGRLLMVDDQDSSTHAYTLSGPDAASFDVEAGTGGGQLMTKASLDFENKDTYTVVVTVDDGSKASNDTDQITVTIEVKDLDEKPEIFEGGLAISGSSSVAYMENGTDTVETYTAAGPMADMARLTLEGADAGYFTLTNGVLTFKKSPDYEMPRNAPMSDTNTNTYMVTVKANDGTYTTTRNVTVMVTNVDELGRLSGPLTVSHMENSTDAATYTVSGAMADDARWTRMGADAADFTITGGMLKFINAPDYESPMGGADNDSNTYMVTVMASAGGETAMVEVTVEVTNVDELGTLSGSTSASIMEGATDSLGTYTLMGTAADTADWSLDGADMSDFMLEGTGMSRMLKFSSAPDYESPMGGADNDSNTYMVTVMASAGGETAMVEVTVEVTNVDELGTLSGSTSASIMEGATDSLGTYTLMGTAADTADWSLDGADMSDFMLEGTGMSRMLKFSSAPDYESPMGGADNDSNTYMVTVMASAGGETAMVEVTVEVTNVDELGTLSGSTSASIMEGATDSLGTYTLMGTAADTADWSLDGADMSDFMLEGTGMSRMLKFSSAPDYESPMGGADNDSNTYMVTVMASAGGETAMVEVTVEVTNVDELGTLSGSTSASIMEGATDSLGTYTLMGTAADTADWSLDGADMSDFMLEGTGMSRMLKFSSAPDYESPMGGADNDSNTYMVTVMASAGGEEEMMAVAIMVTNIEEAGTVTLSPMSPVVGSEVTASLTDPDSGVTGTTWQWAKSMTMDGTFTDIGTATLAGYTPVEDDGGMYLQATASYTDGHGTGKMATSEAVMVSADVVAGYDDNGVEGIQIDELFDAIDDYFAGGINISELFEVIDAYFLG